MFNWKNIFKKRIDQKNIPVLEDIVDASEKKNEAVEDYPHLFSTAEESTNEDDEFVIDLNVETDNSTNSEDDNNVVILSSVIGQTDIDNDEIDVTEIDDIEANITEIDEPEDAPERSTVDDTTEETTTEVNQAETEDNTDDDDTDHNETSDKNFDLSDPEQLEVIVNKVVEQLKPELEQQLYSFVQKNLTEKSPEEFLNSLKLDDKNTSD